MSCERAAPSIHPSSIDSSVCVLKLTSIYFFVWCVFFFFFVWFYFSFPVHFLGKRKREERIFSSSSVCHLTSKISISNNKVPLGGIFLKSTRKAREDEMKNEKRTREKREKKKRTREKETQ